MKIAKFYDVVVEKSYTKIVYENVEIGSLGAFLPVITSAKNDDEKISYTVVPKLDKEVIDASLDEDEDVEIEIEEVAETDVPDKSCDNCATQEKCPDYEKSTDMEVVYCTNWQSK